MKGHCCGSAALLLAALALPSHVGAQVTADARPAALLDVPFVPQSEALCGGAAVSMVLRYWGETGVYAEDFADLVIDSVAGIRTTDLTAAVSARGWRAMPFTATRAAVRAQLAAGRPVLALIEDRPGVFHYVVIVAWGANGVIFHDPARAPFRTMTDEALERAWRPANHWALLILPRESAPPAVRARIANDPALAATVGADSVRAAAAPGEDSCAGLLAGAVAAARRDDVAAAERGLAAADAVCTDRSAVLAQRAGLRFRQQRYAEAAALAAQATAQGGDAYAWELLASSRFMAGDRVGALAAWNRVGGPRNDLTRIDGLRRTPYRVAESAIGIPVGTTITHAALLRGQRRLRALPAIRHARVEYRPIDGGDAQVDAAVVERPPLPTSVPELAAIAARAALASHARIDVTAPFGLGEVWRLEGAWQQNREAVAVGVALPGVLGSAAVASLRGSSARSAFGSADQVAREEQRSVSLGLADWATASTRWDAVISLEDWDGRGHVVGVAGAVEVHAAGGLALHLGGGARREAATGESFPHALVAAVANSAGSEPAAPYGWTVRAGVAVTRRTAPRSTWAGGGAGRIGSIAAVPGDAGAALSGVRRIAPGGGVVAPLRAHPLLDDEGVVRTRYWAPQMVFAGGEVRRELYRVGPLVASAALFVDAVGVRGGGVGSAGRPARGVVDAGAGVLFSLPGTATAVRVDAALGLTDGASALTLSVGVGGE